MALKKCIFCGKKMLRYARESKIVPGIKVVNPYCSDNCKDEFDKKLYMGIGYEDGFDDGFLLACYEMQINFMLQCNFDAFHAPKEDEDGD